MTASPQRWPLIAALVGVLGLAGCATLPDGPTLLGAAGQPADLRPVPGRRRGLPPVRHAGAGRHDPAAEREQRRGRQRRGRHRARRGDRRAARRQRRGRGRRRHGPVHRCRGRRRQRAGGRLQLAAALRQRVLPVHVLARPPRTGARKRGAVDAPGQRRRSVVQCARAVSRAGARGGAAAERGVSASEHPAATGLRESRVRARRRRTPRFLHRTRRPPPDAAIPPRNAPPPPYQPR